MLRVPLLCTLLLATAASATEEDAPKGFGNLAAEAEHFPETPLTAELTPKQMAEQAARDFFLALLAADARLIAANSAVPFYLEDRRFTDRDELAQTWLRLLRSRRVDLHVLYGVEVYSPQEMEQKYGKPPSRLSNLPWRAPKTWIAVGNLSGRPAVAILREVQPGEFLLTGFHD